MENKYYTPEIEEFHMGFEFELESFSVDISKVKDHTNITREEMDSCAVNNMGWFHQTFDGSGRFMDLKIDRTRVKHLDREDIESLGLGFVLDSDYGAASDFILETKRIKIHVSKHGGLSYPEHEIRIYKNEGLFRDKYTDQIFRGVIKNKSELRRLVEQLGIE